MKASATPRTQLATHESRAPAPPFFAEPRSALPPRAPSRQKMPGLVAGSDGKPSLAPAFRLTMRQELRISPGRQRPPWDTRRDETRISIKTRHETRIRPPPSTNSVSPLCYKARLHPPLSRDPASPTPWSLANEVGGGLMTPSSNRGRSSLLRLESRQYQTSLILRLPTLRLPDIEQHSHRLCAPT